MKVRELILFLQCYDPESEVLAFYDVKDCGHLENIFSICKNGDAVQLNLDSTEK